MLIKLKLNYLMKKRLIILKKKFNFLSLNIIRSLLEKNNVLTQEIEKVKLL